MKPRTQGRTARLPELEPPEPATMQSNLRLPRSLWLKMKTIALNRHQSLTWVVQEALEQFVEREAP